MTPTRRALAVALLLLAHLARPAGGQGTGATARVQPELRTDAVVAHRTSVELGGGLQAPLGYYVRIGATAALGTALGAGPSLRTGRADLLVRFLLDPFRQSAYGVSAGGGLGTRFGQGEGVTPVLLLALEVEGRRSARGWSPALQVGVGGGMRAGVLLRRGEPRAR